IGERGEFVIRAPELERPDALQVFGLEESFASRVFIELSGREDRRAVRHALQSFTRFKNIVESQHSHSLSEKQFVVTPLGGILGVTEWFFFWRFRLKVGLRTALFINERFS